MQFRWLMVRTIRSGFFGAGCPNQGLGFMELQAPERSGAHRVLVAIDSRIGMPRAFRSMSVPVQG